MQFVKIGIALVVSAAINRFWHPVFKVPVQAKYRQPSFVLPSCTWIDDLDCSEVALELMTGLEPIAGLECLALKFAGLDCSEVALD